MRVPDSYRYLLACRPDPHTYPAFRQLAEAAGQVVRLDRLHLTLCVVAEAEERDRFIVGRVRRSLRGQPLHAFPVRLSRLVAGRSGAHARTFGRQDEIQDFYRALARRLRAIGVEPMHRKSGLHPHVTLGHERSRPLRQKISLEWFAAELLLIESEVGLSRHNVLDRWPLLPPRQLMLPLGAGAIAAAAPSRRSAA